MDGWMRSRADARRGRDLIVVVVVRVDERVLVLVLLLRIVVEYEADERVLALRGRRLDAERLRETGR
jgi:hypothetical protein